MLAQWNRLALCACAAIAWASPDAAQGEEEPQSGRYLQAVVRFADCAIVSARDSYGPKATPLFVDGLHAATLKPATWKGPKEEIWVLSNFASQQPLVRTLDGLTGLTGEPKYRQAAEDAARHALKHLTSPNGLLYWGGHLAWDLQQDKPVGQYADVHELKGHQPHYELMWRVDPAATRRLLETIWAAHVLDWSLLDYNRHGSVTKNLRPLWSHTFNDQAEVPFPTPGGNLSFCNVTPPLLHCGATLAALGDDGDALVWTRRLLWRWQQGKDPMTGLCGGQLSYRKADRAYEALGQVHPEINEAKIVASYHQTTRYHCLPLIQMQAAEQLLGKGGDCAKLARKMIAWASDDLKIYARQCYDPESGRFIAKMTDGTPLDWRKAKTNYYTPNSFAPAPPDGFLLWGYATAYRITSDTEHWRMCRELARRLELGELGQPDGADRKLRVGNRRADGRLIYALLELHRACDDPRFLQAACRVGDNLISSQAPSGLFPRRGREYARTGDETPLALLHLAAAIDGKRDALPQAIYDSRFFHCEYHGPLEPHQQKRADARTYDHLVYYGE
jgi:pectate lyase